MSYRFDGTDDDVRFSPGSFVGYAAGPITCAALINRNGTGAWGGVLTWTDVAGAASGVVGADLIEFSNTDLLSFWNGQVGGQDISGSTATAITDTTNWMIVAVSWGGASTAPRYHWKIGAGAWVHESIADSTGASSAAMAAADRWIVGTDPTGGDDLNADVTCTGAIKSALSDAAIEALDMTTFASWQSVFTDWLIGFETSATQTDRTGGGGDEVSRAGTSLVSDPAGWTWAAEVTIEAFVNRVPVVGGSSFAPGLRGPGTDRLGNMR